MTLQSRIVALLCDGRSLSDREITDELLGTDQRHQPVNHACRKLAERGQLTRVRFQDGRIRNSFSKTSKAELAADSKNEEQAKQLNEPTAITIYSRERALATRLNRFVVQEFAVPERDYFSQLSAESLLTFKAVLSSINNLMTLRTTFAFVDWLADKLEFDLPQRSRLKKFVDASKPNSNGYDLHVADRTPEIIAEVKCNVPVNEKATFGASQRSGLEKDIGSLLEGKAKSTALASQCLKFLVLLDLPRIREATERVIRITRRYQGRLEVVAPNTQLDRLDIVYVVFVPLSDISCQDFQVEVAKATLA